MDIFAQPYNEHFANFVLSRLAAGETLTALYGGEEDDSRRTIQGWLVSNPEFRARYFAAREAAMEAVADGLMAWSQAGLERDLRLLARAPTLDQLNQAHRTRVAVKQWLMAKWAPKTYAAAMREGRSDASTAAHAEAAPAPPPAERDPAAPPRISPRPFAIPPIADGQPITIPGLAMPQIAGLPDFDIDVTDDAEYAAATPSALGPRPPRRERRAMAAMQRKQRLHPSALRAAPDCNPPPI